MGHYFGDSRFVGLSADEGDRCSVREGIGEGGEMLGRPSLGCPPCPGVANDEFLGRIKFGDEGVDRSRSFGSRLEAEVGESYATGSPSDIHVLVNDVN